MALLFVGGAVIEWFGSGFAAPREGWVAEANAADWIGGVLGGGGLLAIIFGLFGLRNG